MRRVNVIKARKELSNIVSSDVSSWKMKGVILLLALFGIAWTWANPSPKINFDDFPMRRVIVDDDGVVHHDLVPHRVDSRIINGQEVVPYSIPYQVWLLFRSTPGSTSGWTCGGSLITLRYVLTAAHCVVGAGIVGVYIGYHDLNNPSSHSYISESRVFARHENYNSGTITNDVGVIELEEPITITPFVNIVQLPSSADLQNLFEAENVRLSGWGLTQGGGSRSNTLLAVNSTVLPNADCRREFSIFQPSEICISGANGVGACNGDSGGPLVFHNIQVGIVSYGRTGCLSGFPSVFARVTSFIEWIIQNSDFVLK